MKKIIGIVLVILLSLLLGLSVEMLDDGDTTLVSEYVWKVGGVYE